MPIQITCSSCQSTFNAPDAAGGKKAKCPQCGGIIEIPTHAIGDEILDAELEPTATTSTEKFGVESADDRKPCPMCGELIQKEAVKCRFCGEIFDPTLANAERRRGPGRAHGGSVEEAAERLIAEKYNKTTAIQIFVTSLVGCFSPIVLIYGIIFLVRRPYPFPYKGLAIAGTIIHGCWTLLMIASIVLAQLQV